jgi:hypothetical protein
LAQELDELLLDDDELDDELDDVDDELDENELPYELDDELLLILWLPKTIFAGEAH